MWLCLCVCMCANLLHSPDHAPASLAPPSTVPRHHAQGGCFSALTLTPRTSFPQIRGPWRPWAAAGPWPPSSAAATVLCAAQGHCCLQKAHLFFRASRFRQSALGFILSECVCRDGRLCRVPHLPYH